MNLSLNPATSRPVTPSEPDGGHIVQFYESEDFLNAAVASFLSEGLSLDQPVVVVATEARWRALEARLGQAGFDAGDLQQSGQLTFQEAHQALARFMVDGEPDGAVFRSTIGALLEHGSRWRGGGGVRAYGEMVDVLWRDGNQAAALKVEELWNDLAASHEFRLLCAYAMGNFYREDDRERFTEVCRLHRRVLPAETYAHAADDDARQREVVRLQQRARMLEQEVAERRKLEEALRQALADRRRTEDALRHAKEEAERANRLKSDFLAVMSHELRTPLNAIVGYRDLLHQGVGGPVTERQRSYLDRIGTGVQQLLRLVDQVLNLSQIEAGHTDLDIESVDMDRLAREIATLIQPIIAAKDIRFEIVVDEAARTCLTDAGRVSQILLNLLSNAAKFTERGEIALTVRAEHDTLVCSVRDTGIGVAAEDLERIFQPFVRVMRAGRSDGTGLGLPVSRELARILGGDLTAVSEPGVGSTFTFRLPCAAPSGARTTEPAPAM